MLAYLVAIAASIVGLLGSLSTLVLLAAGMANAKPAHLLQGKAMMWGILLMEAASLGLAIWLMVKHRPWPAATVGAFPLVAVIALITILWVIEW